MAKTTTASPIGDKEPSKAASLADSTPISCPRTLDKISRQDKTKEANFDITNCQHQEDSLIYSLAEDANQHLADFEQKIRKDLLKTSILQRKLLAYTNLINYYQDFAYKQTNYRQKCYQYINQLTKIVNKLKVIANRL